MEVLSFGSVDALQLFLLKELYSGGEIISTRELKTLEICNVNICLSDPRNRATNNPARNWNHPLAIGEFAWHISGSNDLDFITYYAKQWQEFSTDGKLIHESCYGHKIFSDLEEKESQWNRLVKLLRQDSFSRRAVLNLYDSSNGLNYFSKDIACACTIQFLVRNNKLDAIMNMRSNDLIWGLPYDVFLFTMLQEMLALELGCELGKYYHNVGSLHIYERHFILGEQMLKSKDFDSLPMYHMEDISSINTFLENEEKIRKCQISENEIFGLNINSYWKNLLLSLMELRNKKDMKTNSQKSLS